MAKLSFPGLADHERRLSRLMEGVPQIAGKAIYAGADLVADEIRKGIDGLPQQTGVTKQGLEEDLGIAPMRDEGGYLNVKIGFDGYNARGIPNALMARVFERGTSTVKKRPFVRLAVNRAKGPAEARMAGVLEEEMKKRMV